jgi:branched-chain amino acid transport system ATP-binding protein
MIDAAVTRQSQLALTVSGVSSGYDRTTILRDISIEVPRASVVALLGPNGAGKTTLLKTISGLITPSRGTVAINDHDVTEMRPNRRVRLGLCHIPEGRGVYRSLSVRDNLVLQSHRGQEQEALSRAVEAFPILGERLGQAAGSLSGGQQQMLAMARAYVQDPKLILVDEASLGLAPIVVEEIFGFLERLANEGAALLIVDQFATQALHMASSAYVLRRGEIVYSGSSARLLESDVFDHYLGANGESEVENETA